MDFRCHGTVLVHCPACGQPHLLSLDDAPFVYHDTWEAEVLVATIFQALVPLPCLPGRHTTIQVDVLSGAGVSWVQATADEKRIANTASLNVIVNGERLPSASEVETNSTDPHPP